MGPIDFLITQFIIPFLEFSYQHIIPNYGVGILLLTILVKLIFYPLTCKQFQSMHAMKKIQPEVQALQKKIKNEPKKLQKEMMGLYKKHNVNPFSGCLPMLVQLPIFLAIFYGINSEAFKLMVQQPGINAGFLPFWITDLTLPDPLFLLPVLVGASTWFSQKMMVVNAQYQKMMMMIPLVMVFICLKMSAGVLLYWASSQIISSIQQQYVTKKIQSTTIVATQT